MPEIPGGPTTGRSSSIMLIGRRCDRTAGTQRRWQECTAPAVLSFRSHEQEWRTPALVGQIRLRFYLFFGRPPFLDMTYREAEPDQHVDIGCESSVLLDDAFG